MRRGLIPRLLECRATAASRSLRASRLRKSVMRRATCARSPDTQITGPRSLRFDPDPAALARPMNNAMIDAAQRHDRARLEGDRLRQTREPRSDPRGVTLGEFARRFQRRARWHGQHHVARRGPNSQRKTPRGRDAFERDAIGLAIVSDVEMRRLNRRPALEKTQHPATSPARPESEGRHPAQPASAFRRWRILVQARPESPEVL